MGRRLTRSIIPPKAFAALRQQVHAAGNNALQGSSRHLYDPMHN